MNKNTFILALIFVLPLMAYFYASKFNESSVTVSNTIKPQIIKFSSNMCSECQRMDITIKDIYPKYKDKIELISIPTQVNNEYNSKMISKYKVTLVPTIIFVDNNQKVARRIEGYVDKTTFDKYMKEFSND
jgi:thioredoxin-related protein